MVPYVYSPLSESDSIRVLEVLPDQPNAQLRARLREVRLNEEPSYAALSYCWGEPKFDVPLICDDAELFITRSLGIALTSLRNAKTSAIVWADAVCINQKNSFERNAQVAQMAEIYKTAEMVWMWLGEEGAEVSGLRLVNKLARAQELRWEKKDTRNRHQLQWVGLDECGLPFESDGYESFLRLTVRAYFARGWTLQEAVLAKKVVVKVGSFEFPYRDFFLASLCCSDLGYSNDLSAETAMQSMQIPIMRAALAENKREELLTLLFRTRMAATTDPRDKIYCLIGLARDAEMLDIQPDYTDTFQNLYRNFALGLMEMTSRLDVLSLPRLELDSDLPSWAPDWRSKAAPPTLSIILREANENSPYQATNGTKARVQKSDDQDTICISGFCVDKIIMCGETCTQQDGESKSFLYSLKDALATGITLRRRYIDWQYIAGVYERGKYITGEEKEDAFWQTLIAGTHFDGDFYLKYKHRYQKWNAHLLRFGSLRRWIPSAAFVGLITLRIIFQSLTTGFALFCFLPLYNRRGEEFTGMMRCVRQRRLVRTSKGYIGLAPDLTHEGDMIALLEGGKIPFVVRQKTTKWLIVGECYVHGMMSGEAFEAGKCEAMRFV